MDIMQIVVCTSVFNNNNDLKVKDVNSRLPVHKHVERFRGGFGKSPSVTAIKMILTRDSASSGEADRESCALHQLQTYVVHANSTKTISGLTLWTSYRLI